MNVCALVFGSHINAYAIVRELYDDGGVRDIAMLDYQGGKCASYSNRIKRYLKVDKTPESVAEALSDLHRDYDYIVVFPTDELQMELLHAIHDRIEPYCFLPYNPANLLEATDKYTQYLACDAVGVPRPATASIKTPEDLEEIPRIGFPVLIKPSKRDDASMGLFRSIVLEDLDDFRGRRAELERPLANGVSFIASEIIPGDGSNIYAYVAYRDRSGRILNEWSGKKLSQFPDDFGVFASAANRAPEIVAQQGRALLEALDIRGIAEPEFKFDARDGRYKLTEINLRSMMWHRLGNRIGVRLQLTQYLDATGGPVRPDEPIRDKEIHLVYFKHEILNLIRRKGYLRTFWYNVFHADKTCFAVLDFRDMKPFWVDLADTLRMFVVGARRRLARLVARRPGLNGPRKKE